MFKKYQLRSYNFRLVAILLITSVYALSIVNSANSAYTLKQGVGIAAAFIVMIVVSFIDFNFITKYYWIWYILGVLMLLAVLFFGVSSHGAQRWIRLGPVQVQPSEFVKIILIIFTAKVIAMNKNRLNTWKFLVTLGIVLMIPIFLVFKEPDMSTTLLIVLIVLTVIFCAGLSYKIIGVSLLVIVPLVAGFLIYIINVPDPIIIEQYQRNRIVDFINGRNNTDTDATDSGNYQQDYAVQAVGSGQLSGKGLNNEDSSSLKNAGYIAEAQNDFIFAVIGEELGFVGCIFTIILLFTIVIECIITAVRAVNFEGRLICCGIAAYIGFQTFINIGVVTKLLPNTGLPLPFFSCGLASIMTLFIAMGLVLNISLQRKVDLDDDMFAEDFRG
ncbi:MAG: FtsW/RodA/SpoVE family cell cycle protein [Lachnospira sp.]